jgi:hypothetical protein
MLTWTCHICKEKRPDAFISVVSKDTSAQFELPPGTMKQNVRYCNDRTDCAEKADNYQHFKQQEKAKGA